MTTLMNFKKRLGYEVFQKSQLPSVLIVFIWAVRTIFCIYGVTRNFFYCLEALFSFD